MVRNNLKNNFVFAETGGTFPSPAFYRGPFSDRIVELIERRVRRGEHIELPDGTVLQPRASANLAADNRVRAALTANEAVEIIVREQLPEVSRVVGEILGSPNSDDSKINAMPVFDVPAGVGSDGMITRLEEDASFREYDDKIEDGLFFIERYIRVTDRTGKYLSRDDKYSGAVNLGVWQKYWDNISLGNHASKAALAQHHFESWKFGYRICFLSKHNGSIIDDFLGLTSAA